MAQFAPRPDAALLERNALAAYARERDLHGLPREMRSVHYQMPGRGTAARSTREPMVIAGISKPVFGPALPVTEASIEFARAPVRKTWAINVDNKKTWHLEAPTQPVAFGSSAPRHSMRQDRVRGLNEWKERTTREAKAAARHGANARPEDVINSCSDISTGSEFSTGEFARRVPVATPFDVATGSLTTPQCNKCGQDRFWCPHVPRSERGVVLSR